MKFLNSLFCFLFLFGMGCGTIKNKDIVIHYTDQNNNRYRITETSFDYTPITDKESSSGIYNGGVPVSKKGSIEVFEELHQLALDIIATAPKETKREMLTTILSITSNGETDRRILRKSEKRTLFESKLVSLKQRLE
tara:strand:- start:30317 stop:30727 length:411 start_codon:yes stop_codon:yes gene_type:complete